MHQGHEPQRGHTGQAPVGEGSGQKKALLTRQFHLSPELKSPVRPGAEGLIAPGPPNAA